MTKDNKTIGLEIVKNLPEDIAQIVWKFVFNTSLCQITLFIKPNWISSRYECLKLLLAKDDDPGILQIQFSDLNCTNDSKWINHQYTCLNCQNYRFPCLNCHYYLYPHIEIGMWKHPLNSTPNAKFRWHNKKSFFND
jgi:hypothetical protein